MTPVQRETLSSGVEGITEELEFLVEWRRELEWRLVKAQLQLVWMQKHEFDALVAEVRSWCAASEIYVCLAKAFMSERP